MCSIQEFRRISTRQKSIDRVVVNISRISEILSVWDQRNSSINQYLADNITFGEAEMTSTNTHGVFAPSSATTLPVFISP